MQLNVKYIGDPSSNRLIIFLHEGLGSVKQWKNFPNSLCDKTNSYGLVYDRKGYGESLGDLTHRQANYLHLAAEELFEIISTSKHNDKPIYLYGHSDGGSIALIFAAKYGHRIKGIITEAAHVFVEDITIAGVKEARDLFDLGKFEGLKKYHGNQYHQVFFAWNDIWLSEEFKNWEIISLLEKIDVPNLIIQGKNDQYGTEEQVNLIIEKTKGVSTKLILENCGHAPHKESQKEVISEIKKWMDDERSSS
ncbi:alpha/beta fold hydrolase [Crocinitomix algicola]|uniref:alpha/beta fold hydrolase n=1 Tax=Crocinitomix algicola TaxID=1740263 RepID=UPI00083307E9|nr:alpha/beta hydrolase [Crocinitomix algicola]